jgi:5'-nucleotidase (lipoprotein e(P4) family)
VARSLSISLSLFVAACAAGAPPTPAASPAPAAAPTSPAAAVIPGSIHWYRTAAEQRALFEQIYAWAGERVAEEVARGPGGAWGVILDADETILDNSAYQLRRARMGLGFTPESWNDWVREEAAPVLPGARAFIESVNRLGGRVAIVTNRDDVVCDATRRNLASVGIDFAVVLCRRPGPSEKESRFRAVQDGTALAGLPPLRVVAWVGDNIHDFPGGNQDLRDAPDGALSDFGVRFFLVPNPMYGSWEANPGR